ncbi:cyclic nucleotide-binding domain-containing protein [Halobacteriovorax sp. RZ-2]|uniref:cyclic nucleotide-gated ion channel n=1 Tax=unclassified Halobacteriovorax TaxID=2639665 RepID=UPI0037223523
MINNKHITKKEILWNAIIFAAVIFTAIEAPFSFIFQTKIQGWQLICDFIVSSLFVSDLFLRIRKKRAQNMSFTSKAHKNKWYALIGIDLIASVPYDILSYALGFHAFTYFRLFRLVRIARLFEMVSNLAFVPKMIKFTAVLTLFMVAVHWISLCWIMITPIDQSLIQDRATHYITAMYWTVTTLTTIGYGDITPTTNEGRLFTMVIMILGVGVYGFVIGTVNKMVQDGERYKQQNREKMHDLVSFMKHYNVPERLQQNVYSYYNHLVTKRLTENDNKIINELPQALQGELTVYMNIKLIRNLPIFKTLTSSCLKEVAGALEQKYYGPGQTIINIGETGHEMYLIGHGSVEVILSDGNVVATLHEGQFFGENALLHDTKRNANVRALGYCELYKLDKEQFDEISSRHNDLLVSITSLTTRRSTDRSERHSPSVKRVQQKLKEQEKNEPEAA